MGRYVQIDFLRSGIRDSSGRSLAGGLVYTYEAGTTTDKYLSVDIEGGVLHPQPAVLDARGALEAFGDGAFKFVIKNSLGVTQYTWDNLVYAKEDDSTVYCGTSTGSSNAYAVTPSPAVSSLGDGYTYTFKANHSSSAAATLNVSGLGVKDLMKADGSTDLGSGDITSGALVDVRYIASDDHFRLTSAAGVQAISAGGTGASTAAGARSNLGILSMGTQASSSVTITGGTINTVTLGTCTLTGVNITSGNMSGMTSIGGTTITGTTINSTGGTFTDLTISDQLTMTSGPVYADVFGFAEVRTIDPAQGTNTFEQTVGNMLCTIADDMRALGIWKAS